MKNCTSLAIVTLLMVLLTSCTKSQVEVNKSTFTKNEAEWLFGGKIFQPTVDDESKTITSIKTKVIINGKQVKSGVGSTTDGMLKKVFITTTHLSMGLDTNVRILIHLEKGLHIPEWRFPFKNMTKLEEQRVTKTFPIDQDVEAYYVSAEFTDSETGKVTTNEYKFIVHLSTK